MEPAEVALERVRRDLDALLPRNTNTQLVRLEGAGSFWNGLSIGAALAAAILCAAWVGFTMGALRSEIQAERQSRESMNNWTAQEVTAIRSYITNGRLQPMKPRPTTAEQESSK